MDTSTIVFCSLETVNGHSCKRLKGCSTNCFSSTQCLMTLYWTDSLKGIRVAFELMRQAQEESMGATFDCPVCYRRKQWTQQRETHQQTSRRSFLSLNHHDHKLSERMRDIKEWQDGLLLPYTAETD
jgi:hypothetical protein